MRIIDLSHNIRNKMPVYPGSDSPVIRKICSVAKDGFMEHLMTLSTHTGTHIDAPAHLLPDGKCLDGIDASAFIGRAITIDCTHMRQITLTSIQTVLQNFHEPEFLLFNTGWDLHWGQKKYFEDFPVPDSATAEFLSELPLKGVGIDAVSFDPIDTTDLENHKKLLCKNILLIENLCNLSKLPPGGFLFSCLPLKIEGADGSPVRAIAIIES